MSDDPEARALPLFGWNTLRESLERYHASVLAVRQQEQRKRLVKRHELDEGCVSRLIGKLHGVSIPVHPAPYLAQEEVR